MPHSVNPILIIALAGFAVNFSTRSIEPLVGVMARDLASDPQRIALLSTAYALSFAFCQPVLGAVGDALGKARIMRLCIFILALTLVACAFAPNDATLFGLRLLGGIAAGGTMPVALALIGDLVAMDRRQVALSRFMVAVIAGQLVGSTMSGLLASFVGWRGVFGIAALLAALAWIALWRGLAPSAAPIGRVDFGAALTRYRLIVAKPRARALFALVFVDGVVFFGLFPYVALLLEARRQGGPVEAGIVIAGFAIGGLLYTALVVWLLRRLGLKGMLPLGGVIGAVAFLVFAIGGHWTLDAAAMLLLGISFYMLHNSFQAQVSEVFPEARGSVMALHAFSYFCGQALSVVLLGFLLNTVGLVPAMILLACGSIGLGLVAGRILTAHPPPPAQPRAR